MTRIGQGGNALIAFAGNCLGLGWLSPRLFERGGFFVSLVLVVYLKREASCNDMSLSLSALFNCI